MLLVRCVMCVVTKLHYNLQSNVTNSVPEIRKMKLTKATSLLHRNPANQAPEFKPGAG